MADVRRITVELERVGDGVRHNATYRGVVRINGRFWYGGNYESPDLAWDDLQYMATEHDCALDRMWAGE